MKINGIGFTSLSAVTEWFYLLPAAALPLQDILQEINLLCGIFAECSSYCQSHIKAKIKNAGDRLRSFRRSFRGHSHYFVLCFSIVLSSNSIISHFCSQNTAQKKALCLRCAGKLWESSGKPENIPSKCWSNVSLITQQVSHGAVSQPLYKAWRMCANYP